MVVLLFPCSVWLLGQRVLGGLHYLDNAVANLLGGHLSAEVSSAEAKATCIGAVESLANGKFDELGLLFKAKRVAEEHGGTQDSTDRVGDAPTCDIRGGTVDWLIKARGGLEGGGSWVRGGTGKGGRGEETERARNDT